MKIKIDLHQSIFKSSGYTLMGMTRRLLYVSHVLVGLFFALLIWADQAVAASTVDCHCFRDRSYSSSAPQKFDPYLLTTTQNRFLAHVFKVSRKEIVRLKMSGVSGDSLWIAHWLAQTSGQDIKRILNGYEDKGSWVQIVKQGGYDPEVIGSHFMAALNLDSQEQLAWSVVGQIFSNMFTLPYRSFLELKVEGASLKEAILASLVALMNNDNVSVLFRTARETGYWGKMTVHKGIGVETIEAYLAKCLSSTKAN